MGEINLYQYPISPFSEKLRRVLVHKRLKWNPIDCHYEDKTNNGLGDYNSYLVSSGLQYRF